MYSIGPAPARKKRPWAKALAYVAGIAGVLAFIVTNFAAAEGPHWNGTWSLTAVELGAACVAVLSYLSESSPFDAFGGCLVYLFLCGMVFVNFPPMMYMAHWGSAERALLQRAPEVATLRDQALVSRLAQALGDPDVLVRQAAARRLQRLSPAVQDASAQLAVAANDQDPLVRELARRALGDMKSAR